MSGKWTFKYGSAAVLVAIVIIAAVLFANPSPNNPIQTAAGTPFLVLLTDPPTVPAGTTVLNLTYSSLSLHVVNLTDGTSSWLPVTASGTVNLFSLVNVTQTIASTTIPTNSSVNKIQFAIDKVEAKVNGTIYNVTTLSNTLVISVENSQVNQTLSGVMIDFNPTLVQIQASDENGTLVNYYVLVPSAVATIVNDLSQAHRKVGTIVELAQNNRVKLVSVVQKFMKNVTIVSASLSVNGNNTNMSVTLTNSGNTTFRLYGLTLNGEFNSTTTWAKNHGKNKEIDKRMHPETIPFKVNGSSLIPLLGDNNKDEHEDGNHEDTNNGHMELSSLVLNPGDRVTLSFNGSIAITNNNRFSNGPTTIVTPIVGKDYTIRLTGEGFETFTITATT